MAVGAGLGALGTPFYLTAPLVIPGSSKFELTLDIKALADGGGNRVYYGNVRYTKKILWLVPVRINIANNSYTAPTGLLPLDTYPGGFYTVTLDGLPGSSSQDWAFIYSNNFFIQRRFSFVPTVSALDIGQGNSALGAGDYLARYVGATPPAAPLNSPFANFTTGFNQAGTTYPFDNNNRRALNNEPHESFSLRSGEWLVAELNGAPTQTNCAAACGNNNYFIVGDTPICTTSDYRINNLPAGTTVTWSVSPNAQSALELAPNVPSPGQVRITNQNVGLVTTTLTATISGAGCGQGDILLTRTISNDNQMQFPYLQEACAYHNVPRTGIASGTTYVVPECMVYVDLGSERRIVRRVGGGPRVVWGTSVNTPYPNTLFFQLPVSLIGIPFTFNITGGDGCGSTSLTFFGRRFIHDARYSYEATPIPAANEVTITAKHNEEYLGKPNPQEAAQPLSYTVEVYDLTTGTRKISQQNVAGSLTNRINIATLRTGYYILHISDGHTSQKIRIYKE